MVVHRKDPGDLDIHTGTTAAQSVDQASDEAEKSAGSSSSPMVPRAVLICRPNSHPFQERHLILDQPVKIGRSVARCRPASNNAIFDCKVLSRNHALLWYENGKFYLQDTKSSNGTFVNNQRLSKGSEESPAREVCSGDIVQFGVDVVENSRKVTHGCIVATLKLYLPDGKEAKASPTTTVVPTIPEATISTHDLYQLSQYLQEALHREQILENKLTTLQRVVSSTQEVSDSGWKALIDEDRLLSRIETLESQLQACSRNFTEDKLREEIVKLQDEKDKYQNIAKDSLKKVLQEKLEAIRKVQDLENSLSNTEEECSHLREVYDNREKELRLLTDKNDETHKEIIELNKKIQEIEEKHEEHNNKIELEKQALEQQLEEKKKEEEILSAKIESVQADCDFAKQQLAAMKARFEQMKKEHNLDDSVDSNGISIIAQDVILPYDDEIGKLKAQLRESKEEEEKCSNLAKELQAEVNRLEVELNKVQADEENGTTLTIIYPSDTHKPNGDLNDELKTGKENDIKAEIKQLEELLKETRENKSIAEEEAVHLKENLNEAQNMEQRLASEICSLQQQLQTSKLQMNERAEFLIKLQDQLMETQQLHKQSQNEAEQLKMKIKALTVEIKNQDKSQDSNKAILDHKILQEECATLRSRINTLEAEVRKYRNENTKLNADYSHLQQTYHKLEALNSALESKGSCYWKEELAAAKAEVELKVKELKEAKEEILLLQEKHAECNTQKAVIKNEFDSLSEELQLVTLQSKTVSACSFIPLVILMLAIIVAFYPSLSRLTATSDTADLT